MEFTEVIENRYSCKDYTDKQVEKEKLTKILEAGRFAPTVLVVTYDKNNVFTYPGEKRDSGVEDATIVATHLLLAAYNEEIDSCWINFFDPQKIAQELNLPENEEVVMMLDLGYGKQREPLPNHHLRKELDETVKYL